MGHGKVGQALSEHLQRVYCMWINVSNFNRDIDIHLRRGGGLSEISEEAIDGLLWRDGDKTAFETPPAGANQCVGRILIVRSKYNYTQQSKEIE